METTRATRQGNTLAVPWRRALQVIGTPWLLIAIILSLYAAVAVPYLIASTNLSKLDGRLQSAQLALQKVSTVDLQEQEQELTIATAAYTQVLAAASQPVVDTEVAEQVQMAAESSGSVLSGFDVNPTTIEQDQETTYEVSRFNLSVRGELPRLVDFLKRLESENQFGLRVQRMDLVTIDQDVKEARIVVAAYRLQTGSGVPESGTGASTRTGR